MPRISPLTTEQRERLRIVAEARAGTPSNRQLANEMGTSERLIEYYVRKYQHEKAQREVNNTNVRCFTGNIAVRT
jgi:transposase-like protein